MKIPSRQRTPLAFFFVLAASLASAQGPQTSDAEKAARAARSDRLGHTLGMAAKARDELRLRHYDLAESLATRAVQDLEGMGGREYSLEGREVLAELALIQGRPGEALLQADALPPRFMVQRFAMTRALALIGLGRTAEARAMVLDVIGTPDKPGFFRQMQHVSHFPLDDDASDAALTATAYLVRAAWWHLDPQLPEFGDDVRAALRFVPKEATTHYFLGVDLEGNQRYAEARKEYLLARTLPGADIRIKRQVLQGIRRLNAVDPQGADDAAKPAGGSQGP